MPNGTNISSLTRSMDRNSVADSSHPRNTAGWRRGLIAVVADAADVRAMANAVESARAKWGSLNGVVHAAGVPGNGRVAFLFLRRKRRYPGGYGTEGGRAEGVRYTYWVTAPRLSRADEFGRNDLGAPGVGD